MFRWLRLAVSPGIEPVSVAEAKLHCRVENAEEDELIAALIAAARQKAEEFCRRSFVEQVWEAGFDGASGLVYLPRPPVQAIEEVRLNGEPVAGEAWALAGAEGVFFRVRLAAAEPGGLVVRYRAGYGATPEEVPAAIRQAVLMLVAHMYEAREGQAPQVEYEVQARVGTELPPTVAVLLQPYRVILL
jgi:uncharacterized phiE125 gp8 family phage protein